MKMITGNEPARPIQDRTDGEMFSGLTIRQHFAAMAMQGILANSSDWGDEKRHHEFVATASANYADYLIAELNKQRNYLTP